MRTVGSTELRARAAIDLGRYEDALREASDALGVDPTSLAAHALRSLALFHLNRFEDALAAAEAGLSQHPDAEWLHRLRANSLRRLGRGELALAAAEEALRHGPQEPAGYMVLAYALANLKQRKRAREAAERAVELAPDNADAHATLGDMCSETPSIAREHYLRSLAIHPNNANVLNNLAVTLLRLGKRADANALLKAALLVDPTHDLVKRNTYLTVGKQLRRTGVVVLVPAVAALLLYPVVFRSGNDFHSSRFVVSGVAIILLNLVVLVMRRRRLNANKRQLQASDPQILDIYRKLEAEKAAGRL